MNAPNFSQKRSTEFLSMLRNDTDKELEGLLVHTNKILNK